MCENRKCHFYQEIQGVESIFFVAIYTVMERQKKNRKNFFQKIAETVDFTNVQDTMYVFLTMYRYIKINLPPTLNL